MELFGWRGKPVYVICEFRQVRREIKGTESFYASRSWGRGLSPSFVLWFISEDLLAWGTMSQQPHWSWWTRVCWVVVLAKIVRLSHLLGWCSLIDSHKQAVTLLPGLSQSIFNSCLLFFVSSALSPAQVYIHPASILICYLLPHRPSSLVSCVSQLCSPL